MSKARSEATSGRWHLWVSYIGGRYAAVAETSVVASLLVQPHLHYGTVLGEVIRRCDVLGYGGFVGFVDCDRVLGLPATVV